MLKKAKNILCRSTYGAALVSLLFLSGCEQMKSILGFDHNGPDEFAVVPLTPLSVPKDFSKVPSTEEKKESEQNTETAKVEKESLPGETKQPKTKNEVTLEKGSAISTESFQATSILLSAAADKSTNDDVKLVFEKAAPAKIPPDKLTEDIKKVVNSNGINETSQPTEKKHNDNAPDDKQLTEHQSENPSADQKGNTADKKANELNTTKDEVKQKRKLAKEEPQNAQLDQGPYKFLNLIGTKAVVKKLESDDKKIDSTQEQIDDVAEEIGKVEKQIEIQNKEEQAKKTEKQIIPKKRVRRVRGRHGKVLHKRRVAAPIQTNKKVRRKKIRRNRKPGVVRNAKNKGNRRRVVRRRSIHSAL
jgi:hypothetical protein